jgi:hypothetical protein
MYIYAGTLSQQKAKAKVGKPHLQHAAPSTQQRTQQQQQQQQQQSMMQQGNRAQGLGQQFKFAPNSIAGKYGGSIEEADGAGSAAGHLPHIGGGGESMTCSYLSHLHITLRTPGASSFHDDGHGVGGGGGYLHEEDRRGGGASGEDAYFSQQQKSSVGMQNFGSFASRNKHGSSQYR